MCLPKKNVVEVCARVTVDYYQYVDPTYTLKNVAHAYEIEWNFVGENVWEVNFKGVERDGK